MQLLFWPRSTLHVSALHNPLFNWPGIDNLFAIVAPDPLHLVLFYFKVLVEQLFKEDLTPLLRERLVQRMAAANKHLDEQFRMSSVLHCKSWNGRESRNFGLLAPYLLLGLVNESVYKL
jgi:hypothetical protein